MEEITVAIAGNPNSGKSTIFNQLTGKRQHTGNWPGVTVEKKEGRLNWKGKKITIVDLPGTYSLTPYTLDERIARDFLLKSRPDAVICVVDASNLERNLYLVIQLLEIGIPVIVDLNMMDVVKSKGMKIDSEKLSEILGTRVVETVATKGEGLGELKDAIIGSKHLTCSFSLDYGREIGQAIEEIVNLLTNTSISESYPIRWMSIKLLEGDTEAILQLGEHKEVISRVGELVTRLERCLNEDVESAMVERRYGYIEGLLRECCKRPLGVKERYELSDRIDTVVTHRLLGIPLFLLVMYITFQLVFKVGNPIADVIDIIFGWLAMHSSGILERMGSPTWLVSFVADGIIGGVGSVIVFLPNILLLFFVIGLLEDTGYLARAAFVMDKFMHTLGLHGKSSIPMILGFGCSIPGIMACRTLNSTKDRVLTILIIPLMSCSARLPIYTLFTAVFFPKHQGTVIFSLYLLGIVLAIGVAQVFQGIFFREAAAPLVMELPPYRIPNIKTVLNRMWERGAIFLKKAGTIIFGAVVFIYWEIWEYLGTSTHPCGIWV